MVVVVRYPGGGTEHCGESMSWVAEHLVVEHLRGGEILNKVSDLGLCPGCLSQSITWR